MADSSGIFINNQDLNEQNSFTDLLESINPKSEDDVNPINYSTYFRNNKFDGILRQTNSNFSIVSKNCQSINTKFDKLQIFQRCINNDTNLIHVITLQKSWGSNAVDIKLFHLPDYTVLYDDSRLSNDNDNEYDLLNINYKISK